MREGGKTITVIGGGPGGYPAAIRAAQLGLDVVLVDRGGLGGTCLHRGCIPTKLLLKESREYRKGSTFVREAMGLEPAPAEFTVMMRRKSQAVSQLETGTLALLRKNGVRFVSGTASFVDPTRIRVAESGEILESSAYIIAAGSIPGRLPVEGADLPGVIDSNAALNLDRVPESVAIIGGGVIGVEFAQLFRNLGAEVTVIEMLPRILAAEDEDVSAVLRQALESSGITVHTGTFVERIDRSIQCLRVVLKGVPAIPFIDAETVLVAVGRKPALDGLNLVQAGIPMEKGAIRIDERMATEIPGIYAVGDAVGGLMLAHKATMEGECAAENAAGIRRNASYKAIPRVVYTDPEIACVGLTEAESREQYGDVLVGKFPFRMSGRAILEGATQGFAKVVAEAETGCIVGVTIIGQQAAQAIGEGALAIRLEATVTDLCDLVHAHPTFSEALREAALDAEGRAVHLPPKVVAGASSTGGRF